jgi:formylglycine-generating enzyme required for sulfatase activity
MEWFKTIMSKEKTTRINPKLILPLLLIGGVILIIIIAFFIFNGIQSGIFLGVAARTSTASAKMQQLATQMVATIQYRAAIQKTAEYSIHATQTALAPTPTLTPNPTPTPLPTMTPIPSPAPNPGTNRLISKDTMMVIYIPAGEFIMGSIQGDKNAQAEEEPAHKVYTDAYWIDRTQVTNAMFRACVNAGACTYNLTPATAPDYYNPLYDNHPVVYVTWEQAATYCTWEGGRLPTEAEWEKAARGNKNSLYAWGDQIPNGNLVNVNNFVGITTAVGLFPRGQSAYGLMDMGGNVREWVSDWYAADYYLHSPTNNPKGPETGEKKVLKGAAFSDVKVFSRVANRLTHVPSSPGNVRGFRCVIP